MSSHVCVIMASRKWKLTHDETEASAQSLDSETYDSEFDDSDEKSDSDAESSGSWEETVDYSYYWS